MASSTGAAQHAPSPLDSVGIDDRYRVERVLGRGGMGEVLAVVELATGKRLALKRLLPGAKPRHAMLFSREFHTLASLRHPHIVQAIDYATRDGVPYYTMELLSGSDVESLAPLPWTEVVPILRDTASALSVLHARHLVHRDVGARNVWRTPEGVVKLIDFGTMTSFGASSDLAGTPPYVAPEALRTRSVDQRTDLYSLGALGYYLLTGRHAFHARRLAELEQYWTQGSTPLAQRFAELERSDLPSIPEPLEQLLEALLAPTPAARPSSAAEVIDRLDHVLPNDGVSVQVALDGVLASKAFVGRTAERKRLQQLLDATRLGQGGRVALLGPRGIGRSRLLAEFDMDARLAGVSVVRIAGSGERRMLADAARATHQLLEAVPAVARACAAPHARVLGHLSEELRQALHVEARELEQFPELLGEARLRLSAALQAVWLGVSAERPLALLLDDLASMDDASRALFSALGRAAHEASLLVVATACNDFDAGAANLAPFLSKDTSLELSPLAARESQEMLRSMFGDAEHLERTAQYLAERAEGNPGRLMELCDYLLHNDKIRYAEGVWVLPQELSELATPASVVQLDQVRLARLGVEARDLASALCVVQGNMPLELCSALSPLPLERMFAALDELCAAGILVQGEHGYAFRSPSLQDLALRSLDRATAERAHTRAGEALLALENVSVVQRLKAGVHLLRGGATQQGAVVVHRAILDAVRQMPEDHVDIALQIEQAYLLVQQLPLSDAERLSFLSLLGWGGYFVERRLGLRYGDEALAVGQRVCGMQLARRLAPWLGRKLALYAALIVAGVRLGRLAKTNPLVPDLKMALRLFMAAGGSLAGMYGLCMERDKVIECARAIEPLTALGPDHAASIAHRFALGCVGIISDALGDLRPHWKQLIARLEDPRPITELNDSMRLYYRAACLYAWGSSECWRDGDSQALPIADQLEAQPLKLYQISADQLRAVFHAQQGDGREAARCRARVEALALQRGMTWQVEVWGPCSTVSVASRQRDAMALKQAGGQLRNLGADTPSLRDYIDIARGSYLTLRGRPLEAIDVLEAVAKRRSPSVIGYANVIGLLAHAYNALGRFADAERVAAPLVARMKPSDRAVPGLTLRVQIELARARAGLGQSQAAAQQLDALIAEHTPNAGPLTLGALHEARTQLALRMQQEEVARTHMAQMERWYRSTDCPGLLQQCDRLARRWNEGAKHGDAGAWPQTTLLATVSHRFTSDSHRESLEDLVSQLVRGSAASEGALYVLGANGHRQVVKSRDEELPQRLHAWVDQQITEALDGSTDTEDADDPSATDGNQIALDAKTWRVFPLISEHQARTRVVGAVALCEPEKPLPDDVQRWLARQLAEQRPSA